MVELAKVRISRRIFQDQWAFQEILNDTDPLDQKLKCLLVVRDWIQIVTIESRHTRPAHMITEPDGIDPIG